MTSLGKFTKNMIDGNVVQKHNKLRRRLATMETRTGRDEGIAIGQLEEVGVGDVIMDPNGLQATADIHSIEWWLPLNLANDNIAAIYQVVYDGTEFIYVCGRFDSIGNKANSTPYCVARYSLITRDWEVIGTAQSFVYCLAYYSGTLYAGGEFTDMNGVANTVRIAKWNGSVWSALGNGATGGNVLGLAVDGSGNLYATGAFTLMNGVANTVRIAKWDGATWSALSTGLASGQGNAVLLDNAGNVWIGGSFSGAGGVANTAFIAKWTGSAYVSVGVFNGSIFAFAHNSDKGETFVGGDFTTIDSVAFNRIASYITSWAALGEGLNDTVLAIGINSEGNIIAGGDFTNAGDDVLGDNIAIWNGTVWKSLSNAGVTASLDGTVHNLLILDNDSVVAVGAFNRAGSINCQSIAVFCKTLSEAIDIIASLFELYAPTEGTYTPTLSNTTNVAASTPRAIGYQRIGRAVHVFGNLDADPTAATANTVLGVSLPIASDFVNDWDLGGAGIVIDASQNRNGVSIIADTTNNRATFSWWAPDGTNRTISFSFHYRII